MIEGVTILAQEEILDIGFWEIFAPLLFSIFCILIGVFIACKTDEIHWLFIISAFAVVVGLVIVVNTIEDAKPTGEHTYKVTIDETVSMTEFHERYEIIDQDGLIYKIKERKVTSND